MNKFIFFSFSMINFDSVFDIKFANLFSFTHLKEVCNSNDKNPNENSWIKKIPLFKMAYSPLKNVRAQKRDSTNWSKMRRFSFRQIDLHFVHWNPGPRRPIFRDIRGWYILPVTNVIKWGSTFNHHNLKNDSTIDVYLNFFVQALIIGRNWNGGQCGEILFLFKEYVYLK